MINQKMALSVVKEYFGETLNRVARGERVVVTYRGDDAAALIPLEDLRLLEEFENRADVEADRRAFTGKDGLSLNRLRKQIGLGGSGK